MAKITSASPNRHDRDKELFRLARLLQEDCQNKFTVGDELARLVEVKNWLMTDLAKYFHLKRNRLSEIYHTAKMFKSNMRKASIPFTRYELARIGAAKFHYSPQKALKLVMTNNINQRREAKRFFVMLEHEHHNLISRNKAANSHAPGLTNNCHHADCRIITQQLADKSVKIVFFDAPYGRYGKYKEGRHNPDAASQKDCDNMSTEAVKQLLDDMFRLLAVKVADGGVVLLCRPGGIADPLHYYITNSADRHGWEISNILVWDKGKIQLGNAKAPYSIDNETIWVIHRKGDKLENHNGSSPKTVLRFSPVAQRSMTVNKSHIFTKPIELCRFLINKHSYEKEVIFDACGCSGNFSIAAIESNRQFIYAETNKVNFEFGSQRIFDALQEHKIKAI